MLVDRLRPVAHMIRSAIGTNGLSDRLAALEARSLGAAPRPVAGPPAHDVGAPPWDVNMLLHNCRGALLRGMPPGARRLLSAGCAGTWYFDWITRTYGPVPDHLGIEFYSPEPPDLPANVTWIANTASNMSGVADKSCDLVFSGQNLEHLWPEEVAGFALEAARVLETGGHLVVDSPNRLLTEPLNWSHPQHTIELTCDEAAELLTLAGFDVTARHGIWLCRDARTGEVLPFDPNAEAPGWSVPERILLAQARPADSFIWWIEGVRADRPPDAEGTRALMTRLFDAHWPERVQRLVVPQDRVVRRAGGREWVECEAGQAGPAFFGPYMPLRAGRYRVRWRLEGADGAQGPAAFCDVVAEGRDSPLAAQDAASGDSTVALEFALTDTTFGVQFRCFSTGRGRFSVQRRVELEAVAP